ncbi:hypothetical protein GCM10010989_30830 [Croceicoccus pelagius]|uniref:Uncharacterized protein n=1 Tax=Croceicoccus pelagius TaxID=1703341 RepID=A0A917DNG3_9SPHN|nr:hypothetical protein GCM10010989_30830 [Croceicoccus pelagius]
MRRAGLALDAVLLFGLEGTVFSPSRLVFSDMHPQLLEASSNGNTYQCIFFPNHNCALIQVLVY